MAEPAGGGLRRARRRKRARSAAASRPPGIFPNLDFLPEPAAVLANLRPDDDGVVRVPLADLGDRPARARPRRRSAASTVYAAQVAARAAARAADRRLRGALDPGEALRRARSASSSSTPGRAP